jgi:dihydrofolate reductase
MTATGKESSMMVSVFIGTSLDGFIARPNGDLDFLPPGGGEPHGYDEFIASVDVIVIGRKTFETVVPSTCPRPAEALSNRWPGLRLRSFRNSLPVVPTTSTSTVGSRFKGSYGRG